MWKGNQEKWQHSLHKKVEDTEQLLVQQFEGILEENVSRLENLKYRLELLNCEYSEYWGEDARRIVESTETFKFIEWIDSTMVIQRIEPLTGNEIALGYKISKLKSRKSDWQKARKDSVFNMTPWLQLAQGGAAFLVDEPVYMNGDFYGTITAAVDYTTRFDQLLQGMEEYNVQIADDNGKVFYSSGSKEGTDAYREMMRRKQIEIGDANQSKWTVSMTPNNMFGEVNSIAYNNVVLGLTIILSLFLAFSFFLIQELAMAERTTKVANERLRAFIETVPLGVYIIDSEGYIKDFWNSAAEEMLGWKRDEVIGNFLPQVTDEFQGSYQNLMKEVSEKKGTSNREVVRKRKDGTLRTFSVNISKIIGEGGQMLVVFEDITKEKENEQKLIKSLEEKKFLLSEIHHRVKNNLAIIIGLIELQNEEVEDETTKLNLIETKNRIYSISGVHELLYQTDNFSNISFSDYINQLVNRLHNTFETRQRPVKIKKTISGLRVNLNQAIPLGLLLNELITNSYKHAFESIQNPEISLNLYEKDGYVEVEYKDNGVGTNYEKMENSPSMGIMLIRTSLQQLSAEYNFIEHKGFGIFLRFPGSQEQ